MPGAGRQVGRWTVVLAAGALLFAWLLNTPGGLLGKADAIGYAVCHRIDLRSFHLGERPISLCARCTGMYLGAMFGMLYLSLLGRRRSGMAPRWMLAVLGALAAAFAFDGVNSWASTFRGTGLFYAPNNTLRLITGTGMGLVMAAVLLPTFHQTAWKEVNPEPVMGRGPELLGFLGVGALSILLFLGENPLILYPLALVSAGGVLVLLTMVYGMMGLILTRRENRYGKARELLLPLTGGFLLALLQIAVFDLGRYALTGTWEGFHVILG